MFNKFEKKVETPKPVVEKVEKVVETPKPEIKASNIDEKVIGGKLYKSVGYMENGCSKYKLEEVK